MESYRINANYAKALFMLAGETGHYDEVAEDMRLVSRVCGENRVLNTVFNNPTILEVKKRAIVADLFGEKVCRESLAFLNFVVKKNRSVNLRGIADAYLEMYRESKNVILSKLTTAFEVDESVKQEVSKLVSTHTGKTVELETKVDQSIIGGLMVEFNNTMYDSRISAKIAKLRREFNKNYYESKL